MIALSGIVATRAASKFIQLKRTNTWLNEEGTGLEQAGWHSYPNDSSNSLIWTSAR